MVVCRFYGTKEGCKFGNNCKFEHPNNVRLQNNNSTFRQNNNATFRGGSLASQAQAERWSLNNADIESDLTTTRPKWILSAYGPGRDTPATLFVENEYSPEEIRWRYYQQAHVGNGEAASREAIQLWQKADNDMLNVARNVKDVQPLMEEKERTHPNRYDFCKMDGTVPRDQIAGQAAAGLSIPSQFDKPAFGTTPFGQKPSTFGSPTQQSPFGQAKQSSPFGPAPQPSIFGKPAQSSAFGQPAQPSAFGQPAQPSAFGQSAEPSPFSQPSQASAFGKPAFGQSSTPGQPAFGQTGFGKGATNQAGSRFGAPISNQSPFGTQTGSAFGQPSPLGQNPPAAAPPAASGFGAGNSFGQSAQPSAFGKPAFGATAAPTTGSPFGGGAAQNNKSPFGSAQQNNASPFGSTAQNQSTSGGFGNAASANSNSSPFGQPQQQQTQAGSPFAQPQTSAKPANPFGQSQASTQNPFGQPQSQPTQSSPFGQTQQQAGQPNPFGQNRDQSQQANPFGQVNPPQQAPSSQNPFARPQPQPQQIPATQSPFGQQPQSGVGAQTQSVPQNSQPNSNPFGAAPKFNMPTQPQAPAVQAFKPTDKPIRPLHYSQTLQSGQTKTDLDGNLSFYCGQPVKIIQTLRPTADGKQVKDTEYPVYNRPDGTGLERIWFPNGLGEVSVQKLARVTYDFQDLDDAYTEKVKEQYGYLFENGGFKDHKIPLLPPERGWLDYDF